MKTYLISAVLGVVGLICVNFDPSTPVAQSASCECGDSCQCDPCECNPLGAPLTLAAAPAGNPFVPNTDEETEALKAELNGVKADLAGTHGVLASIAEKSAAWDSGLLGGLTEEDVRRIAKEEIAATGLTEDYIRKIAREEAEKVYEAKVAVKSAVGTVRSETVRTSQAAPGHIVLNPGEVLLSIDGVPVNQSDVYATQSGVIHQYSTPSYQTAIPRTFNQPTRVPVFRTPARNFLGNVFGSNGTCGPGGCN